MKHQSRLESQQQEHLQTASKQETEHSGREYATAEELLREDARQVVVPPEIARRLEVSAAGLPGPKMAWWKRLLGGNP
jgi:hypothetical protein